MALNLAPLWRVVLVDTAPGGVSRIGESLVPAARRLLRDMGLLEAFLCADHTPWYANRFRWGTEDDAERDFLADPDSPGWHLDRAAFETSLRREAIARGGRLFAPARAAGLRRQDGCWQATIQTAAGAQAVSARLLVDASGRAAAATRHIGARRQVHDRLVCGWLHGAVADGAESAGISTVHAETAGWWYTAPIPGRARVLAFHTDADLPPARAAQCPATLLARAHDVPGLAGLLERSGFQPTPRGGFTTAHQACLEPASGADWLAVGDAALAFDPLSSRGLFTALYTGFVAATAIDRRLRGSTTALTDYADDIITVWTTYRRDLAEIYRMEQRWPQSEFWRRRHPHT